MKKIGLLLFSLGFFAASCSSDSEDNNNNNNSTDTNFLPLTTGNYWVYDVQGESQSGRDSLYIANDTVIGSNTYKKFKTEALPTGFFSGAMNNNGVRVSGKELLLSGSAVVPFSQDFPVSIAVSDFTIFKEDAATNAVLDEVSGTITQDYEGIPLNIDYTLTAKAKESVPSYTVNGQQYNNVMKVETVLHLQISATIEGVPFPLALLPEQDVLVSTQYYADGIGVVHVVTDFQYQLDPTLGSQLPVPQSGSEHQEEILDHYNVAAGMD